MSKVKDKVKEKKNTKVKAKTKEQICKEINISVDDFQTLLDLYMLRSYSGFEEPTRKFVCKFLDRYNIPYINYNGNIIGLNHIVSKTPLLSAHMDMVNTHRYTLKGDATIIDNAKFFIDDKYNISLKYGEKSDQPTSLGADDKSGIWITLMLLKHGFNINFVFSHGEEVGCVGIKQIVSNEDIATLIEEHTQYALVLDRRNAGDIIGYDNKYCMALDDKLERFSAENGFKYTCASGLCSDANSLSDLVETVNLSVGYYKAHTSDEYTNLKELINAKNFVEKILTDFKYESVSGKRMREFKGTKRAPYETYVEPKKENPRQSRQLSLMEMGKDWWDREEDSLVERDVDEVEDELLLFTTEDEGFVVDIPKEDIVEKGRCPYCYAKGNINTIDNDMTNEDYNIMSRTKSDRVLVYCENCQAEFVLDELQPYETRYLNG